MFGLYQEVLDTYMYTIIHVHKNGTATCILPEKVQLRPVMLADTQPIFPEVYL